MPTPPPPPPFVPLFSPLPYPVLSVPVPLDGDKEAWLALVSSVADAVPFRFSIEVSARSDLGWSECAFDNFSGCCAGAEIAVGAGF